MLIPLKLVDDSNSEILTTALKTGLQLYQKLHRRSDSAAAHELPATGSFFRKLTALREELTISLTGNGSSAAVTGSKSKSNGKSKSKSS